MTKITKLCRGVQGFVQGFVQGKTHVPIGLCRVCRANARTCARNSLNNTSIYSVHSRAHGQHPCTPLHTLHTPYSMRVTGGRTPAQTPAHPCTRVIYSL